LSKTENELITQLGEQFYATCEADLQSGKTAWIGIVRDEGGKWAVRFSRHFLIAMNPMNELYVYYVKGHFNQ
jgi:hypothetical protein